VDPATWTGQAIGRAVWWALTRLLTDSTFWAGLTATLLGVFLAFRLERWRDRRHAREQYARTLNAVRYESAALHAICSQALTAIQQHGGLTSYELEAPALRNFVASPLLHEHAGHGLTMVLGSLVALVGAARNSLAYFRSQVGVAGLQIAPAHLAPLTKHLTRLKAGLENAQGLMDRELQRLQRGVIRTVQDQQDVQAFQEATQ
jgi:hypothetical protein